MQDNIIQESIILKLTETQYKILKLMDKYKMYLLAETTNNNSKMYHLTDYGLTKYNNDLLKGCDSNEIAFLINNKFLKEVNITTGMGTNVHYYKMVELTAIAYNTFKVVTADIKLTNYEK